MTRDEFANLLQKFAYKPVIATSGRHVYLWHSNEESLRNLIPSGARDSLNLHILVDTTTQTPYDRAEAARIFQKLLRDWLKQNLVEKRQHVVVVTGCDLLVRYQVPLTTLFQWVSDTIMFVLVVQDTRSLQWAGRLPNYVTFNPQSMFTYLKEIVGETALIETEG